MTPRGPGRERAMLSVLLLLTALGCAVIAAGTESLVRKNEQRRAQARRLADCVARPDAGAEGPIQELDGMFGRALLRVNTELGPSIVFDGRVKGGRS